MWVWLEQRLPVGHFWRKHFTEYRLPDNLNLWYLFGSIALFMLFNQLATGIWLMMFYTPSTGQAFASVEYIMREVDYGWLIRYLHAVGASALFLVLYLHVFRSLMYGSYRRPRELVWILGVLLLLAMMAEAFCGYLLPWGQLSYWGAQVITDLLSAIPYVGDQMVLWLRGDYQVADATLHRFFSLHVTLMPLMLLGIVALHVLALRQVGSNNPEGVDLDQDDNIPLGVAKMTKVPFHPYYTSKDLIGLSVFLTLFFTVVFFMPDMGGYVLEPANFEQANPMATPEAIAPLWYMTPFYSMLRVVPDKGLGILVVMMSIAVLFTLPWLDKSRFRSVRYRGWQAKVALSLLVVAWLGLIVLGTMTLTPFRQFLTRLCTVIYFAFFLLMPFYTRMGGGGIHELGEQ